MNYRNIIPLLTALLLTSCAQADNSEIYTDTTAIAETTTVQTTTSQAVTTTTKPADTAPVTIEVNQNASLAEQVADALYFLGTTEGNVLHDGYYASESLMDVNFDGVPEIRLYGDCGTAAIYVCLYSLNGEHLGSYGIPLMDISYNSVENEGKKLLMMTGKRLNFHPQNGEEGPTDYHFISVWDFDTGEKYEFSSTIIYEDDTLEKILSATVRTDDVEIIDTATVEEIEMYYSEFMADYSVISPVDAVPLILNKEDLSSKEIILEKILPQVQEFETLGKE